VLSVCAAEQRDPLTPRADLQDVDLRECALYALQAFFRENTGEWRLASCWNVAL
jgi:hypothetical protein